MSGILNPTSLTNTLATTLRRRVQFARTQEFSRCGAAAFRLLGVADGRNSTQTELSSHASRALINILHDTPPREVTTTFPSQFSCTLKSACEVGPTGNVKASVGAVLVNESGKMCRHLGSDVPSAVYGRRGKLLARPDLSQY